MFCLSGVALIVLPVLTARADPARTAPRHTAASVRSVPASNPESARAALARARQLMAAGTLVTGTDILAEGELRCAVALAPHWAEPRRELARWYSRHAQSILAMAAWRDVLDLEPRDREARAQFERARLGVASLGLTDSDAGLSQSRIVEKSPSRLLAADLDARPERMTGRFRARSWVEKHATLAPALVVPSIAPPLAPAPVGVEPVAPDESEAPTITTGEESSASEVMPASDLAADALDLAAVPSTPPAIVEKAPVGVPREAWVALARARQLMEAEVLVAGADTIAGWELRRAATAAPQWIEAQRELARWHTRQTQWPAAAIAWRSVLVLRPTDHEARTEFERTRHSLAYSPWAGRTIVALGISSDPPKNTARSYITSLAETRPLSDVRLAAATSDDPAAGAAAPPKTGGPVGVLPPPAAPVAPRPALAAPPRTAPARPATGPTRPAVALPAPTQSVQPPVAITPAPPALPQTPLSTPLPVPVVAPPTVAGAPPSFAPSFAPAAPVRSGTAGLGPRTALPVFRGKAPSQTSPTRALPAAPRSTAPRSTAPRSTARRTTTGRTTTRRATTARAATRSDQGTVAARPASRARVDQAFVIAPGAVSRQRQAAAWPLVERAGRAMQAQNYALGLSLYQRANALDPNNSYAKFGVPETLMILKRYDESANVYRRILARHPGHPKALRGLADVLAFSEKYDEAIGVNQQLLAQNRNDFAANHQIAQILTWTKRYAQADPYYRTALAVQPRNVEAWTSWGEALSFNNDPRAKDAFSHALALQPDNPRALQGIANVYAWNSDYPRAITSYNALLAKQPRNAAAHIGLGDALTFSSRSPEAIAHYRTALAIAPDSSTARLGLGRALVIQKQYPEGAAELQRVVATQPNNTEALELLALAQSNTQEAAALATYRTLLLRQQDPKAQAETLGEIADLHIKLNEPDKARLAYEDALQRSPDNTTVALRYAQWLSGREQWEQAQSVVARVLEREPGNLRALTQQVVLESKLNRPERADALVERLEALQPANPDDALQMAFALREIGNVEAARRVLVKLAARPINDPAVALQTANALRDANEYDAATSMYQSLIAGNPNNLEARLEFAEMLSWQKKNDMAKQQIDYVLAREPGNIEAKVLSANLALNAETPGGLDSAARIADDILKTDPTNPEANQVKAQSLSVKGQFADAIKHYQTALKSDVNNLEARLGLARNLYYAKQTEESIKEYQELIRRAPTDNTVKLELAQLYLDQNRFSDAEVLFNQVIAARRISLLTPMGKKVNDVVMRRREPTYDMADNLG